MWKQAWCNSKPKATFTIGMLYSGGTARFMHRVYDRIDQLVGTDDAQGCMYVPLGKWENWLNVMCLLCSWHAMAILNSRGSERCTQVSATSDNAFKCGQMFLHHRHAFGASVFDEEIKSQQVQNKKDSHRESHHSSAGADATTLSPPDNEAATVSRKVPVHRITFALLHTSNAVIC